MIKLQTWILPLLDFEVTIFCVFRVEKCPNFRRSHQFGFIVDDDQIINPHCQVKSLLNITEYVAYQKRCMKFFFVYKTSKILMKSKLAISSAHLDKEKKQNSRLTTSSARKLLKELRCLFCIKLDFLVVVYKQNKRAKTY